VWSSFTAFGNVRFYNLLAIDLARPISVDLEALDSPHGLVFFEWGSDNYVQTLEAGGAPLILGPFSRGGPVLSFRHLIGVPRLPLGDGSLLLLGEAGKYVPVSRQRIAQMVIEDDLFVAKIEGAEGEQVAFVFHHADTGAFETVSCSLDSETGRAVLMCQSAVAGNCTCQ